MRFAPSHHCWTRAVGAVRICQRQYEPATPMLVKTIIRFLTRVPLGPMPLGPSCSRSSVRRRELSAVACARYGRWERSGAPRPGGKT